MTVNLEQERCKYAFECIKSVKSEDERVKKEYLSHVKTLPILILTNGLGNAIAFVNSKRQKQRGYELLYNHVNEWCKKRFNKEILDVILQTSSLKVYRATDEVLALLNWLKRFGDAELAG